MLAIILFISKFNKAQYFTLFFMSFGMMYQN